ncbi:hypothetical protein EY06_15125, partial [Staphylococcus aureus]
LHPVGLVGLVLRVGQLVRQRTVIRQQQQAFAVMVQAAGGIHARRQAEPGQGRPRRHAAVGELAEHVEGLVEGDQHCGHGSRRVGHCPMPCHAPR